MVEKINNEDYKINENNFNITNQKNLKKINDLNKKVDELNNKINIDEQEDEAVVCELNEK